jgi:hypothetical protein
MINDFIHNKLNSDFIKKEIFSINIQDPEERKEFERLIESFIYNQVVNRSYSNLKNKKLESNIEKSNKLIEFTKKYLMNKTNSFNYDFEAEILEKQNLIKEKSVANKQKLKSICSLDNKNSGLLNNATDKVSENCVIDNSAKNDNSVKNDLFHIYLKFQNMLNSQLQLQSQSQIVQPIFQYPSEFVNIPNENLLFNMNNAYCSNIIPLNNERQFYNLFDFCNPTACGINNFNFINCNYPCINLLGNKRYNSSYENNSPNLNIYKSINHANQNSSAFNLIMYQNNLINNLLGL